MTTPLRDIIAQAVLPFNASKPVAFGTLSWAPLSLTPAEPPCRIMYIFSFCREYWLVSGGSTINSQHSCGIFQITPSLHLSLSHLVSRFLSLSLSLSFFLGFCFYFCVVSRLSDTHCEWRRL
uniref:Uncharacterized protein n=1 Tax=Physcomitrium patens TaxID=3218 RepID=A0A2K1KAC5_PHYPA|nr:hypothetical protein PHYPA_009905 [Physcomitrium patens]